MKKVLMLFLLSFALVVCRDEVEKKEVHKVDDPAENDNNNNESSNEVLSVLNALASLSEDTDELYITDDLFIGEEQEVKPGIYDLEVTGGSGNIFGERVSVPSLFINWLGGADGKDYPSKIRVILFEGDSLEFSDISKVKFHAVGKEVESSDELGIGEFVVERDILPRDYKLSTNAKLSEEFENLGWDISIYNDDKGKSREQMLTGTNDDVAVSLEEGEIISIKYDNTDHGSSSDEARLIFAELE